MQRAWNPAGASPAAPRMAGAPGAPDRARKPRPLGQIGVASADVGRVVSSPSFARRSVRNSRRRGSKTRPLKSGRRAAPAQVARLRVRAGRPRRAGRERGDSSGAIRVRVDSSVSRPKGGHTEFEVAWTDDRSSQKRAKASESDRDGALQVGNFPLFSPPGGKYDLAAKLLLPEPLANNGLQNAYRVVPWDRIHAESHDSPL